MGAAIAEMHWAVALIMLPLLGAMACFLWPTASKILALLTVFGVALSTAGLSWQVLAHGVYRSAVGGWGAPLGIDLYADGLSLVMLVATALVGLGVSVYSAAYFERGQAIRFWPLWLFLLAALNALFLSGDIFNLYVTLELLGLAAVALAALAGGEQALNAAMRYLLAALLGSLFYLLGVALLYHGFGSVDITTLSARIQPVPATWAAMILISIGLALKTALVPLHFWLPRAHASAAAPVSALLSALVVKGSFYILLRLWLEIFFPLSSNVTNLLGWLGAAAVLWGSFKALAQTRLKLLVAYSTVAQIGYLFLAFPLAVSAGLPALQAVMYLAFSHSLAKAAMFLAAGNLLRFSGHDRIADLDRVVQRLPLTAGAFALAGVSIMGLPPSGGFIGKWLLLETALAQGRWDIVAVLLIGGLLAAMYIFKVLGHSFTRAPVPHEPRPVFLSMQWTAILLALAAIALGLLPTPLLSLINVIEVPTISGAGP